jgi:hypothetical protein
LLLLADGLDHRPELVDGLPGVEQLTLGALLPPLHPVELDYLVRSPFLTRLPKALLMSLAGEALFDIHGGEDLFALCAYVYRHECLSHQLPEDVFVSYDVG